jgi:hypothetical protein
MGSRSKRPVAKKTDVEGPVARVRAWLKGLLPSDAWRIALAFASGLLTMTATMGGLFIVLPWAQSAIVAGIAVGLVAPKIRTSAIIGACVGLAGIAVGPENYYRFYTTGSQLFASQAGTYVGSMIVCMAVAAGVSFSCRRLPKAAFGFLGLAFLLVIGNLWFTTLTINAKPLSYNAGISFNDQLRGNVPGQYANSDSKMFFDTYMRVNAGGNFYPEYSKVLAPRGPARSIADFRVPTLFWLWNSFPSPSYIVIAFLLLATAAIVSVIPLGVVTVKLPLTLPAAAALASYMLFFTGNIELFRQEQWAGAIGVLVLGCLASSLKSNRWKLWTVAAVACAVLAVLTRETMMFLLLAGFASAFFGGASRRRFRLLAWGVGLLAFAVLYAAHMMAAQPYIVAAAEIPRAGRGSITFMLAALNYATDYLGYAGWLPITLAAMGIAGGFMVRDRGLRIVALVGALAPLVACLVLGNDAYAATAAGGGIEYINYWGPSSVMLLYALAPSAFAIIPGANA